MGGCGGGCSSNEKETLDVWWRTVRDYGIA
jgi:hypothetical protein